VEALSGSVERIIYYNSENGYSILRLRPETAPLVKQTGLDREGLVTVTGNLPEITSGEYLNLKGEWKEHPRFGLQFQAEICEQSTPSTVDGIRRYLGSGLVKGIGPRLADRIVSQLGIDTLQIIENEPHRLREVPDIGRKRAALISAAWEEQKQVKEIMLFLHSHAISSNLAVKIYKKYGDTALHIVKSDPYRLARDLYGVGFRTADRIARALGLPSDHPSRIEAGLIYVLNAMNDEGHVFVEQQVLMHKAAELLEVDPALLPAALTRLEKDELVWLETLPVEKVSQCLQKSGELAESVVGVYLAQYYFSEKGTAEKIAMLSNVKPPLVSVARALFLDPVLSQDQQEAVRNALLNPVSVLTGGPGTGKTTCLKALIASLDMAQKKYALASPTGRAAKRLSEATGRPASTIHRLLGFNPGEGFKFNAENPLPVDMLILDEVSMLDLMLAHHLLKALRPGTHLLLVGDVDQLPSVGAGDVLRDIIASDRIPVTRLSAIFRQAAHSQIVTNAHRINGGEMPDFASGQEGKGEKIQDFYLFTADSPEETAAWIEDVVCRRIPQKFGLDPINQVQVLAPMYRGPAGVTALNTRLQAALNPADNKKPEKILSGQVFRTGDKLMQTQNNYDKDVYNGDFGRLTRIDLVEHMMEVNFDGRVVSYDWSEADQLALAYAVSVHKSQGSEFPAVVLPLVTQHYMMLQRNLLYTAVTRARQLCVLVGSRKAISIAVRNNRVSQRCTALHWRVRQNAH
jgi:exodeoxyribonuclease V alpha subunit